MDFFAQGRVLNYFFKKGYLKNSIILTENSGGPQPDIYRVNLYSSFFVEHMTIEKPFLKEKDSEFRLPRNWYAV